MARPKGVIQKRRESKYWLPPDLSLKPNQTNMYTKTTPLTFIDSLYGEFVTSFHNIHRSKGSNHPKRRKEKTKNTCLITYGTESVSAVKEIRNKAHNTMQQLYGVNHALNNSIFIEKSKKTTLSRYGVDNGMKSEIIKAKLKKSVIRKYGTDNPMKAKEIKLIYKKAIKDKYGVTNIMQSPIVQQNWIKNTKNSSAGERELNAYVQSLGLFTEKIMIGGNKPREIDILIKEKNIGIEYNGSFHHSEGNKKSNRYHLHKYNLAKQHGIELLQFFDYEWEGRKEQVKSFLKAKLQKNTRVIYARKTVIKEVSKLEARWFLDTYHILGACPFKKVYGLYFQDELLSLVTINPHHYNNTGELAINRYIVKHDVTVIGGLPKLTKYAVNIHGPLITWIDLRWSNGNNWIKMGWKFIHQLPPSYIYLHSKTGKIISKQSRKKNRVKTPKDMTEHQHALLDGLYRIYDCGKIKLKYEDS